MIRLYDILFEEKHEPYSVWRTEREQFGAMNTLYQVRYFDTEEDARDFASGKTPGPHTGKPEPKQHRQHGKSIEKYAK